MSYLVLARKWRPTTFDEVVGQAHVTQTLSNALNQQRVAHALLFTGSRGIGKTTCARILAKALNCDEGPTVNPCGVCPSCVDISAGKSTDVFEIDGASNNGVEQVREIREAVKFVSTRGKRKIYVIDEVHMLSTAAFNALLKTLEEPPPHVLFIFATTEPHKIPETIVSRCQRFDFKRIPQQAIVDALSRIARAESIEVEPAALQHIARESKGGMRDSLSLLDQVIAFCGTSITEQDARKILGIADRSVLHGLTQAILTGDGQGALNIIDELFRHGLDLQKFAAEFVQHLRDLMVIKVCPHPERLIDIPGDELALLAEQIGAVSPARLHRLFNALITGAEEISRSNFPKLVFEMTVLRLCEQGPTLPLAQVLDGLARLEARLDAPLPPDGGGGPERAAPPRLPSPAPTPGPVAPSPGNAPKAVISTSPARPVAPTTALDQAVQSFQMQRGSAAIASEAVMASAPAPVMTPVPAAPPEPIPEPPASQSVESTSVSRPNPAGSEAVAQAAPGPVAQATPQAPDAPAEDAPPKHYSAFSRKADGVLSTLEWPGGGGKKSAFGKPAAAVRKIARAPRLRVVKPSPAADEDDAPAVEDPISFGARPPQEVFAELIGRLDKWEAGQLRVEGHLLACTPERITVRLADARDETIERFKGPLEAMIRSSFVTPPALDIESCAGGHPDLEAETVAQYFERLAKAARAQRADAARNHPAVAVAARVLGAAVDQVVVPRNS